MRRGSAQRALWTSSQAALFTSHGHPLDPPVPSHPPPPHPHPRLRRDPLRIICGTKRVWSYQGQGLHAVFRPRHFGGRLEVRQRRQGPCWGRERLCPSATPRGWQRASQEHAAASNRIHVQPEYKGVLPNTLGVRAAARLTAGSQDPGSTTTHAPKPLQQKAVGLDAGIPHTMTPCLLTLGTAA